MLSEQAQKCPHKTGFLFEWWGVRDCAPHPWVASLRDRPTVVQIRSRRICRRFIRLGNNRPSKKMPAQDGLFIWMVGRARFERATTWL